MNSSCRPCRTGMHASAHSLLHERTDPRLHLGCHLGQGEAGRPHGALVQVRLVAESERRVARLELLRALEEADDLAVQGLGGHPIPEPGARYLGPPAVMVPLRSCRTTDPSP